MQRDTSIDITRFIFAFLVVVIHIPLFGRNFIVPFARCAVPFFYIIAGFYLYTNDQNKFRSKLIKNIKKWFSLWLTYTLIFAVIRITPEYLLGNDFTFHKNDVVNILTSGVCETLDIVRIKGNEFAISSVLWFLHAGFLGFIFLYFIRKYICCHVTIIIMSILLLVSCFINCYYESIIIYRSIGVAIPFIYIGCMIRKYLNKVTAIKTSLILKCTIAFTITLYIEALCYKSEVYFSTIILTLLMFVYLLKAPDLFGFQLRIPVKVSMDIYIWHRLIYTLLFGFFNLEFLKDIAAIIVFCIALLLFTFIRLLEPVK